MHTTILKPLSGPLIAATCLSATLLVAGIPLAQPKAPTEVQTADANFAKSFLGKTYEDELETASSPQMKAILKGKVIAESDDIVHEGGYHYFPRAAMRVAWLKNAEKTASDRTCPHGVQFHDVVTDGEGHERANWT
jgi:uncharacterized protein (DUF427 family)